MCCSLSEIPGLLGYGTQALGKGRSNSWYATVAVLNSKPGPWEFSPQSVSVRRPAIVCTIKRSLCTIPLSIHMAYVLSPLWGNLLTECVLYSF